MKRKLPSFLFPYIFSSLIVLMLFLHMEYGQFHLNHKRVAWKPLFRLHTAVLWHFIFFQSISAYSGHYRPTDDSLNSFLSFLKENGVNLDEAEVSDFCVFCSSRLLSYCYSLWIIVISYPILNWVNTRPFYLLSDKKAKRWWWELWRGKVIWE